MSEKKLAAIEEHVKKQDTVRPTGVPPVVYINPDDVYYMLEEIRRRKGSNIKCDVCKKEIAFRFTCSFIHNHFAPASCQIRPETTEFQLCLTCSKEIAIFIGEKMGVLGHFYGKEM